MDQGDSCASDWSMAATAAVETQHMFKSGKLLKLSEQQITDCCHDLSSKGCSGGSSEGALMYLQKHGLELNENYPYTGKNEFCILLKQRGPVKVTKINHLIP